MKLLAANIVFAALSVANASIGFRGKSVDDNNQHQVMTGLRMQEEKQNLDKHGRVLVPPGFDPGDATADEPPAGAPDTDTGATTTDDAVTTDPPVATTVATTDAPTDSPTEVACNAIGLPIVNSDQTETSDTMLSGSDMQFVFQETIRFEFDTSVFTTAGSTVQSGNITLSSNILETSTQKELDNVIMRAYTASFTCDQFGAVREVFDCEMLAVQCETASFLARCAMFTNAAPASQRFCPAQLSNQDSSILPSTNFFNSVDVVETPSTAPTEMPAARMLQGSPAEEMPTAGPNCDCPPPPLSPFLSNLNGMINSAFGFASSIQSITGAMQLCNCDPRAECIANTAVDSCPSAVGGRSRFLQDMQVGNSATMNTNAIFFNTTCFCTNVELTQLTKTPTKTPTKKPTMRPTMRPTAMPTQMPSMRPSRMPSMRPSRMPSMRPSRMPTMMPTQMPSQMPSNDQTPTTAPQEPVTPAPVETTGPVDIVTPAPVDIVTPAPQEPVTPAPQEPETPAPQEPETPAPQGNSTGRFLVWDGEEMVVEDFGSSSSNSKTTIKHVPDGDGWTKINPSPFAYRPIVNGIENKEHVCHKVDAKLENNAANKLLCSSYLNLPLITQKDNNGFESCSDASDKIPKTWYTVGPSTEQSLTSIAIEAQNPSWDHEHYGDESAKEFILDNCGIDVANAYECLAPPAYRADLFRFCALYTKGGLYMDSDIMPLVKLEKLYDPCSVATIGHDWPQGRPQKQMKILAGQQGAPIFLCMINKIVTNIRSRSYPENPLALTGPMVLHDCYEQNNDGVSITYRDTRDAAYPYSGMRGGSTTEDDEPLLAFEVPHNDINGHDGTHNYKIDFESHEVYRPTCPLHDKITTSASI